MVRTKQVERQFDSLGSGFTLATFPARNASSSTSATFPVRSHSSSSTTFPMSAASFTATFPRISPSPSATFPAKSASSSSSTLYESPGVDSSSQEVRRKKKASKKTHKKASKKAHKKASKKGPSDDVLRERYEKKKQRDKVNAQR